MNLTAHHKTAEIELHPTYVAVRAEGMDFKEFVAGCVQPRKHGRLVSEMRRLELIPPVVITPGWRFFARGLAYVLAGKCFAAGFLLKVKDYLPPLVVHACVAPGTSPMIDFMLWRLFGTLELCGSEVTPAEVIASAYVSFSEAKVVVITRYSSQPLLADLWAMGLTFIASVDMVRKYPGRYRVVVASIDTLGDVGFEKADIVLAVDPYMADRDDARRVTFQEPADVKKTCKWRSKLADVRGRLFCIRTNGRELSPWEAAGHAEAFGMATLKICSPFGMKYERPVGVITLPSTARLVIPHDASPQTVKGAAALCPITMRRLAKTARAIRFQDRKSLEKLFESDVPEEFFGEWNLPHLIYAGTLDAAERLGKLLPDWPILDGACELPLNGYGVIATEAGVRRCRSPQLDLILRADFGPGIPPFPKSWFTSADPFSKPVYMIDFTAGQHPMLRKWTCSRQDAYLAADWREWGQHPAIYEYRRFLRAVAPRRAAR